MDGLRRLALLLCCLGIFALGGCDICDDDDDDCDDCDPKEISVEADAGDDREVPAGTVVRLDGSASLAYEGNKIRDKLALGYEWTQIAGPAVTLGGADTAHPWFTAPAGGGTFSFWLTVSNAAADDDSTDSVQVQVMDYTPSVSATLLSSTPIGEGGEGRAEISAFHPGTDRVFTTNAEDERVDVTNISTPTSPTSDGFLDLAANFDEFEGGGPNSVAVFGDWVAVAIEADDKQDDGVVQFWDAATLGFIAQVTAGALPDMVTFTPDGSMLLVANEGEPSDDYLTDPEGSVTIIEIPGGGPGAIVEATHVTHVDFNAFDGTEDDLRADGVRIFGPGASVSQDLEPEYIGVSPDGSMAYVACQENNAVALLDLATKTITDVVGLGYKKWWDNPALVHDSEIRYHVFQDLPELGTTVGGQTLRLGGFSGLWFVGTDDDTGAYRFVTIPDRGPNLGTFDVDTDGEMERPFPLPDYQARIVHFEADPVNGRVEITGETPLVRADGVTPITGRCNLLGTSSKLAYYDEEPVNLLGQPLALDAFGGDFEGILVGPEGDYWMCDEYRPAIYRFSPAGVLRARYVPDGSNGFGTNVGTEAFPAVYAQRRANRGFEAIAFDATSGKLYAWIQSPIDVPDTADDSNSKASRLCRILEFDIEDEEATGEFVYVLDGNASSDKVGDAVWTGRAGEFLVLERNSSTGDGAVKNVYRIDINGATNLLDDLNGDYDAIAGTAGALELTAPEDLGELSTPVVPVEKTLHVNLSDRGYRAYDKPEGLALLPGGMLAVLNDNDFGIAGATADYTTGVLTFDPDANTQVALALVDVLPVALDASNKDGHINLQQWPIYGIYHPDAIAVFGLGDDVFVVSANEGDAREYEDEPGYVEEDRVKDVDLDPVAFPDAATLQREENLGRLKLTLADGDLDGDGDYDRIFGFGARSFSIWNGKTGDLVYDSGDLLARRTIEIAPERFNGEGDAGSFDDRSDDKGTEPEAAEVGVIDGVPYIFIGLERFGGVMVFEARNPASPTFLTYIFNEADVAPEGVKFVSAADSPTGEPLLIVSSEASGTLAVWQLDF